MRIIGIDPALSITGYGIIDMLDNRQVSLRYRDQIGCRGKISLALVEAGIITTSSKCPLPQRLEKIYESVLKLINRHRPDVVALEGLYAHKRHPTTAYILGHARGVICLVAKKGGLPLAEYPATRVKKAVLGKGQATKAQMQRMVSVILGINKLPGYYDVTDALALAIAHSYLSGVQAKLKQL